MIENRVRHICQPDPHAGSQGTYVIRSLYFDSYSDNCYQESLDGVDERKKYRIRIYNGSADVIKLECKYSTHGLKAKDTCRITRQQCEQLINGKGVTETEPSQEVLRRFLWERSTWLLTPRVIVEYTRAPYVYTAGNVRVTFDRYISSSAEVGRFLDKEIVRRGIMPEGQQLLEVKYDNVLPGAIGEFVAAGQQMSRTSFSKYALCRMYGMG